MTNVNTSTKGVHKKLFSDISLTDDQSLKNYHGLRATYSSFCRNWNICRSDCKDMDSSRISVSVDDCLDQDQT